MEEANKLESILIIGADGSIGASLEAVLSKQGKEIWTTTRKPEKVYSRCIFLDMSEDIDTWKIPEEKFDTVYICAAVTSIDRCEKEPEITRKINVINTSFLAEKFANTGAFIIFLSSTAVFDGEIPFVKASESISPKNNYGMQKAEAEKLLSRLNENIAIVRISKVITPNLSLLNNWVNDLRNSRPINPFYDMVMAPLSLLFVTQALIKIAENKITGILQLSANNDISYEKAAKHLANKLRIDESLIQSVSFRDKKIEFSPKNTTFDCNKLATLGISVPSPLSAFDDYLIRL